MKTIIPVIFSTFLLAGPETICSPPLRCDIFKNELQSNFLTGQRCEPIFSSLLPEEFGQGDEFETGFKLFCDANNQQDLGINNES